VAGEAINKIILAAMGFIGNHHHVAPQGERWQGFISIFREKLLDGGENDST
jgi:hypothetical protein